MARAVTCKLAALGMNPVAYTLSVGDLCVVQSPPEAADDRGAADDALFSDSDELVIATNVTPAQRAWRERHTKVPCVAPPLRLRSLDLTR